MQSCEGPGRDPALPKDPLLGPVRWSGWKALVGRGVSAPRPNKRWSWSKSVCLKLGSLRRL